MRYLLICVFLAGCASGPTEPTKASELYAKGTPDCMEKFVSKDTPVCVIK